MFDISTLSAEETFDIEILDPRTGEPMTDEGKIVSVTVYGPGSKPFAAAKSKASNRAIERFKRKGKTATTPEEDAAATASFLAACTKAFNNFNYKGMDAGPDMFRACYEDIAMGWITEQVNREMGDWGNFTKAA